MNVADIQNQLRYKVGWRVMVAKSTFVLGSPWESDFLYVTAALYWHEFEIKVSRSDFLADLRKRNPHAGNKHDFLAGSYERKICPYSRHDVPRPKSFYFVAPASVTVSDVPAHAGLINWSYNESRGLISFCYSKLAPTLKADKLTLPQLYSLAKKVSHKSFEVPA